MSLHEPTLPTQAKYLDRANFNQHLNTDSGAAQLPIHPDECIDCSACVSACPVSTMDVPDIAKKNRYYLFPNFTSFQAKSSAGGERKPRIETCHKLANSSRLEDCTTSSLFAVATVAFLMLFPRLQRARGCSGHPAWFFVGSTSHKKPPVSRQGGVLFT